MRVMLAAFAALTVSGAAAAQSAPAGPPPCSQPEYRQLDFWVGDWDGEASPGTPQRAMAVNHITKDEYGSCVIAEHFTLPASGAVGGSVSTWDAQTKQWRQVWVDNSGAWIPLVGGPVEGQPYVFELRTTEPRGPKKLWFRMIWEDVTADAFTWRWQSRAGDEDPWADAWVIRYTRRKG